MKGAACGGLSRVWRRECRKICLWRRVQLWRSVIYNAETFNIAIHSTHSLALLCISLSHTHTHTHTHTPTLHLITFRCSPSVPRSHWSSFSLQELIENLTSVKRARSFRVTPYQSNRKTITRSTVQTEEPTPSCGGGKKLSSVAKQDWKRGYKVLNPIYIRLMWQIRWLSSQRCRQFNQRVKSAPLVLWDGHYRMFRGGGG